MINRKIISSLVSIIAILLSVTSANANSWGDPSIGHIRTVSTTINADNPDEFLLDIGFEEALTVHYFSSISISTATPNQLSVFKMFEAQALAAKANGAKVYIYSLASGGRNYIKGITLVDENM